MRHLDLIALLLTACGISGCPPRWHDDHFKDVWDDDWDKDGTLNADDCYPHDPAVHPGAEEICDYVDDDCDGEVDNNPTDGDTYYGDADGDGFFDYFDTVYTCGDPPSGYGQGDKDCDDTKHNKQ